MTGRLLLGGAWLGVVGAVAFAGTIVASTSARATPLSCTGGHRLTDPQGRADPKVKRLPTFLVDSDDEIEISFDDSRDSGSDVESLTIENWDEALKDSYGDRYGLWVEFGDGYLESAQHKMISATEEGLAGSIVAVTSTKATLCLAVTPKRLNSLKAGSYAGTIQVSGGQEKLALANVHATLSFRASRWIGVGVALLGVLVGLSVRLLSEASAAERGSGEVGPWQAVAAYASQPIFALTAITGLVAGAFVYWQVYIKNGSWGATSDDFMKLFGLCFVAQLSSSEGINLVRRATGSI